MLQEARQFTAETDFKGNIHDVGGPTADFRAPSCEKQLKKGVCARRQCLFPQPCKNLKVYHSDANFLLVKVTDADAIYDHLVANGIIVRNRNRVKGCEGCLRITIGTPAENVNVIDALKQSVGEILG